MAPNNIKKIQIWAEVQTLFNVCGQEVGVGVTPLVHACMERHPCEKGRAQASNHWTARLLLSPEAWREQNVSETSWALRTGTAPTAVGSQLNTPSSLRLSPSHVAATLYYVTDLFSEFTSQACCWELCLGWTSAGPADRVYRPGGTELLPCDWLIRHLC